MSLTITQYPAFIQAVYNPLKISVTSDSYQIGQLLYCEVWTITDKNMRNVLTPKATGTLLGTLTINGAGDGTATFDISSLLSTMFQGEDYNTPPFLNPLQCAKNESGYVGYYFKLGTISYNLQNKPVKQQLYELPQVQWVVRAALPQASNNANYFNPGNLTLDYCYRHDYEPAKYATYIPDFTKRNRSEDTLLPFFCPYLDGATNAKLLVVADLFYADTSQDLGVVLSTTQMQSGGLFVANVYPNQFTLQPKYSQLVSYTVRIQYQDDNQAAPVDIIRGKTFRVSKDIPFPNTVLFMNRLGGWDSMQVRKDTDTAIKFKSNGFQNTYGNRNYYVDATTTTTYYSSYLTQPEFTWLKDLKLSPVIFLNGEYVLQQDGDFKLDSSVGLFNYELVVAPEFDENAIRL